MPAVAENVPRVKKKRRWESQNNELRDAKTFHRKKAPFPHTCNTWAIINIEILIIAASKEQNCVFTSAV